MVVECVCKRGGWWCTTIGGDIKDKWERKKMVHDQFNNNLFGQSFPKFPIKLIWPTNWHRLNFARDWPNNCTSSSSSDNHWHYHHNHRPHDENPLLYLLHLYRWVRLSGQYCERLELSSAISVITIIRLLLARYYLLTVGSVSMQSSARQSDQVLISAHPIITIIIIITIGFFCHEAAPLKGIKLISIHLFLRLFVILKLNKVRTS